MNAKEAIDEINRQTALGVNAFMVVSMTEDDMEQYLEDDYEVVLERFRELSDDARKTFMALLVDDLNVTFEESHGWGFENLLHLTIDEMSEEPSLDDFDKSQLDALFDKAVRIASKQ